MRKTRRSRRGPRSGHHGKQKYKKGAEQAHDVTLAKSCAIKRSRMRIKPV
jgi:hypothetical protein